MIDASGYQRQHDIHRDLIMAANDAATMVIILQKLEEIKEGIKEIRQEIRATHAASEANAPARLHNSRVGMEDRLDPVVAAATHEAAPGVPNTIQQVGAAVAGSISSQPQPVQKLPTLWDSPCCLRGAQQYHPAGGYR